MFLNDIRAGSGWKYPGRAQRRMEVRALFAEAFQRRVQGRVRPASRRRWQAPGDDFGFGAGRESPSEAHAMNGQKPSDRLPGTRGGPGRIEKRIIGCLPLLAWSKTIHSERHESLRGAMRRPTLESMPDFDNGVTAAEAERLAFLAEECAEAIQAVGKILRHGWESHNPRCPSPTNRQMLETELGDIRFAMALLAEAGDVSTENIKSAALGRVADPGRYMHHQAQGRKDGRA